MVFRHCKVDNTGLREEKQTSWVLIVQLPTWSLRADRKSSNRWEFDWQRRLVPERREAHSAPQICRSSHFWLSTILCRHEMKFPREKIYRRLKQCVCQPNTAEDIVLGHQVKLSEQYHHNSGGKLAGDLKLQTWIYLNKA